MFSLTFEHLLKVQLRVTVSSCVKGGTDTFVLARLATFLEIGDRSENPCLNDILIRREPFVLSLLHLLPEVEAHQILTAVFWSHTAVKTNGVPQA